MIIPAPSEVETIFNEIDFGTGLKSFLCVDFCIDESTPLHYLLGAPSQEPPLLLERGPVVAPGWA